jgi:hypothetical protein
MSDTEPQPDAPPPQMPVKTPQRLRQEEAILWTFRILILVATLWAGAYGWMGLTWSDERLQRLAEETSHGTLQFAVTVFLGAELMYYLYLSASLRDCREWGMWVWALGTLAVLTNLRFGI